MITSITEKVVEAASIARMPRRFVDDMSHATDAGRSLSSTPRMEPCGRPPNFSWCRLAHEGSTMSSINPQQAHTVKSRLRERAAQLRGEIQRTLERSSDETHVRIAEQARDTEDDSFSNLIVDLNLAEIDRDADELRRIDTALVRLSDGSYGLCQDCGQRIPQARLEAEPTAIRCIQCQEMYEKTHAGGATPRL